MAAPQTSTPTTVAPQTSTPTAPAPQTGKSAAPQTSTPTVSVPAANAPETSTPGTTEPKAAARETVTEATPEIKSTDRAEGIFPAAHASDPAPTGIRPAVSVVGELETIVPPMAPPIPPAEPRRPTLFRSGRRTPAMGVPIMVLPPLPDADAVFEVPFGPKEMTPTAKKALRRRRRVALAALVVVAAAVLVGGQIVRKDDDTGRVITIAPAASALPPAYRPGGVVRPPKAAEAGKAPSRTSAAAGPKRSAATEPGQPPTDTVDRKPAKKVAKVDAFTFATGYGPVLGTAGKLRRFRVAVDRTLSQSSSSDFADEVDDTLGDSRSWVAGRTFRLQRVPADASAEFTVYLASARMSTRMCAAGGLIIGGFTSCRLSGQVVINDDRWQDAVPDYGASVATYRAYTINHEVGHQLGHGHEACPGKGERAPVMQQQTYGLMGCVANAWPYVHGKRYTGPRVD
jgi:Protein of unknown function (DUF3152)